MDLTIRPHRSCINCTHLSTNHAGVLSNGKIVVLDNPCLAYACKCIDLEVFAPDDLE